MNTIGVTPVIPLIQAENPTISVRTAHALKEGGLTTLDVVLRTDAGMACMEAITMEVEGVTVVAGTMLTPEQLNEAAGRGAQFIVSPGSNADVVEACKARALDDYPGIINPSELQFAWNLGLRIVKFFPAKLAGGVLILKALSSVFQKISFLLTDGVSASNLQSYLEVPSVVACGGSWPTPQAEIEAGNFGAITALATEAVTLAREVKPDN